jgi:hypothetical protein
MKNEILVYIKAFKLIKPGKKVRNAQTFSHYNFRIILEQIIIQITRKNSIKATDLPL